MRIWVLPAVLLILLTGFNSQPASPDVSCRKSKLLLGNLVVNKNWDIKEITDNIGQPNRKVAVGDTIYVYDSLGIFVRKPAPGSEYQNVVREVELFMSQLLTDKNAPKNAFKGKVVLGNMKLTSATAMFEVKEKLKGFTEHNTSIPHTLKYYAPKEGLFVWLNFTDNELRLETITFEVQLSTFIKLENKLF